MLHALSLVVMSWGYSSLWPAGLSLWWLFLWPTGSRHVGFSCPWHVESSWTRDQTCVPALEGGFLPTIPPGKSGFIIFKQIKKKNQPNKHTLLWLHWVLFLACVIYLPDQGLNMGSCIGSVACYPLDHQESPVNLLLNVDLLVAPIV